MRINLEQQELALLISAIENAQISGKDSIPVAATLNKLYKAFEKASGEAEVSK